MDHDRLIDIKASLRALLQSTTERITIEQLNRDYCQICDEYIPYESFGYNTLEQFLRSLQDTVQIIGHGNKAQVHFIKNEKCLHIHHLVMGQRQNPKRRKSRKNNYRNINQNPMQFDHRYSNRNIFSTKQNQNMTKKTEIDYVDGVKNLNINKHRKNIYKVNNEECTIDFATSVNTYNTQNNLNSEMPVFNVNVKENFESNKFSKDNMNKNNIDLDITTSILNTKVEVENIFDVNVHVDCKMDDAIPSCALNDAVHSCDVPEFAVPFGTKIPPYSLDYDIQKDSGLKICISEVHNPFKFWFQIQREDNELDQLMYNIENHYNQLFDEQFCIPEQCIIRGQVCCTLYNGLWHRAEILNKPINGYAKVFFVDYGTVANVEINGIKYLQLSFAELPAQAIRGSLSHIKPVGLHWTTQATSYFLYLVREIMLYANVTEIDKKEHVIYMVICKSEKTIVQINTILIKNNYALYNNEWNINKIKQNGGEHKHHPREDFPKFSMLEYGDYPTYADIIYLEKRGIDYESIYDKIIYNTKAILNINPKAPECIKNLPFYLLTTNPFRYDIFIQSSDTYNNVNINE